MGGHPGAAIWPEKDKGTTGESPTRAHPPQRACGEQPPEAALGEPQAAQKRQAGAGDGPPDTRRSGRAASNRRRRRLASRRKEGKRENMAKIRMKRGTGSPGAALDEGELYVDLATGKIWAGTADGNKAAAGSPGEATAGGSGLMSAEDKQKLDAIEDGANRYTHPGYTARAAGLYKVTVDETGHVPAAEAVTKGDITALGIPAQDTTYAEATTSESGLMSASDKTKLDALAAGGGTVETDATLTKAGAAADAKAVGDMLRDLMYEPVAISSFTCSPSVLEKGGTADEVTLSWALSRTPESLTLDGAAQDPGSTGLGLTGLGLTADKTWTLAAVDERGAKAAATAKLTFLCGVYYGAAADAEPDGALLNGLTKSLQSGRAKSFTADAGDGQYIWYACPAAYGTPTFNVGGFDGGFTLRAAFSFTNGGGYTESYNVYRSDNAGLGKTAVKVS